MTTPSTCLFGRNAVVTGASSGIGRALAIELASAGTSLVLGGRMAGALRDTVEAAKRAGEAHGIEVLSLSGDVREEAHVQALIREAEDLGGLDLMVNNAGEGRPGSVVDGETDTWRAMLETNLLAVCIGSREAARSMRTRDTRDGMGARPGTIVNMGSLAALDAVPGDAVYSATKHGVRAFSHALRLELLETGIHVMVVHPGPTMTSFGRSLPHEHVQELAQALGIDPASVPDFTGGHAPESFVEQVLQKAPRTFLDPRVVAEQIVRALLEDSATEDLVVKAV